jgi:hypothetical protein
MSKTGLVITAVVAEGRGQGEVARDAELCPTRHMGSAWRARMMMLGSEYRCRIS